MSLFLIFQNYFFYLMYASISVCEYMYICAHTCRNETERGGKSLKHMVWNNISIMLTQQSF